MSIKINFPQKPTAEEVKEFGKCVDKFNYVALGNQDQALNAISKAKTEMEIRACKYCAAYRRDQLTKAIKKQERAIKKGGDKVK